MQRWLDALLSVLLAPRCVACMAALECPTQGSVCSPCWASITALTPPFCETCSDPIASWRALSLAEARCARCRRLPRFVDRARAAGRYEGALRSVVHALKYDGRRALAKSLGGLMQARGEDVLRGADCAVPVPLHWSRRCERGFNQSRDLAHHLGLPVVDALSRVRATRPQAELPAARRHGNVRAAFGLRRHAPPVGGRIIVLVDDVSTTGATLDACAHVLKLGGAAEVRALTAARVVSGPP